MEESQSDLTQQRLQSSLGTSSSSVPRQQQQQHPQQQQPQHLFANRFDLLNINSMQIRAPLRHFSPNNFSSAENNSSNNNGTGVNNSNSSSSNNNNNKRPSGIPPSHPNIPPASPYSQIPSPASRSPAQLSSPQSLGHVPSHTRSLSQPAAFFSLDSLPPLSPSPYRESPATTPLSDPMSADVSVEDRADTNSTTLPPPGPFSRSNSGRTGDSLPPRKAHRRSHSEIPFGFSLSSFPLVAPSLTQRPQVFLERSVSPMENLGSAVKQVRGQFVKQELDLDRSNVDNSAEGMGERKPEGDAGEDLFSAFMNLDGLDALNSSGAEDKREDLDSRASGSKSIGADSSENEAESSVNESGSSLQQRRANHSPSSEKKEGTKRSATGDPGLNIAPSHHCRSVSMDSFMGKTNFADDSPKLPPSPGPRPGQHSHNNSLDGTSNMFSLDLGNGEFSGAELKKIMANEKLAEIALSDPKRAKRILANRQSAARSKERKMKYISELEHKVQTLQTEATTLSAQLTLLQRDSAGLTSQNNELKFRLQAMQQQAQLRDALNEALTAEVQRLKLANQEIGEAHSSNSLNQHRLMNPQMFQLHQQQQQQQQSSQLPVYQQQQQQENSAVTKDESNQ